MAICRAFPSAGSDFAHNSGSVRSPVQIRAPRSKSPANAGFFVSVQLVGGHNQCTVELGGVERSEAEAVYDAGREVVVEVLLRMDRQIQELTARVERLERQQREELA